MIGALLLSKESIVDVIDYVEVEDFHLPGNATIFQAVLELFKEGADIDAVTVASHLGPEAMQRSGGHEYLIETQAACPSIGSAVSYAKKVSSAAMKRLLYKNSLEVKDLASGASPADTVLDHAEKSLFNIAKKVVTHEASTAKKMMAETLERLELLQDRGDELLGLSTGFRDLDSLLSGLQPGALYVLGARPAMGKSAFATQLATTCVRQGRPAVLYSLEMSAAEIAQRILASETRVPLKKIRDAQLSDDEWGVVNRVSGEVSDWPLVVDDFAGLKISSMRARARRIKAERGDLGLVVVDYVQLMTGKGENRQTEVAHISRGLKMLARELDVPVVALAQLNRGLEQRTNKRPMMSDLRESGSLEQDADVVMFLYRDEVYSKASAHAGVAEVIVAKHRQGATGTGFLGFRGMFTRFDDLASEVGLIKSF